MHTLGTEYTEHKIFQEISEIAEFYDSLSHTIMKFISQGTKAFVNLDTYVFTSIKGTLDSIFEILYKGRINDSYALLRKYYDSTVINIYTNLYLNDHFSFDNLIVKHIDDWRNGTTTIPEYRIISKYIKESCKLKSITELLSKDELKSVRDRCNDHTHYNYYQNLLLNDNKIYAKDRTKNLDIFLADLLAIFIQHFSYLFYLNEHYMMSSDYTDSLDLGIVPEEGSQYWVAPFVQRAFNKWIVSNRPDIAEAIKKKTTMMLE